ncbi:MAG: RNA-binding S4 domain-containing protein [Prevotella sp.]|nr:RNA-binding S4 domain-containing protein [Prevotella sp.]
MDQEFESKQSEMSAEQNEKKREGGREGYVPVGNYQRDYRAGGRQQRPRIHTQRAYSSEQNNREEGGFRPEGFGAGLQSGPTQQRPYRPRYNQQGGYQPRQQQGYRPRYNQGEGEQQGYRPRYNQGEGEQQQGGYQPRQQQGYRPRYNQGEGDQQQGGYQPRQQQGYRPRYNQAYGDQQQGGYQPRQQQGYRPRYNQQGGGYQQRGGYQSRGGYGQSYGPQQGGYRKPRPQGNYDPNAKYSMKKRIEYKEDHIDPNEPIRLNKFLANAGVCSRREADEFIQAGVVTVNGEVVKELGTKVLRTDQVVFHDQPVTLEKKVYVLLNKPKDTVTTSDDPQQRKTVMDLVKNACPERIYPVGRLDRNTTGVLLLTNDGDLASKLTHPKFLKKKVYHVYLDKNVTAHDIQQIAEGITLEDGEIHADAIAYADDNDKSQVGIEIHSGKNRIVRRIFESLGYRVVKLDRVQFAGLTKKNLRRGDWRFLTEKEVEMLRMGAFE